ncbi:MAG TPA: ABC transporter ATP-binding protein [Candidatus Elarobacter sp.]|jgi:putative ABC transport system ATP-binding protein|nr:ABC transporter ATP-binding protein [Candidatus Elarobacter sp.]
MLIDVRNITKVYAADTVETYALAGVSFAVDRGEYVAIEGPSGCGKSTLLSVVGLLDVPSSGTYLLNGQEAGSLSIEQRARLRNRTIGFVFQNFNLIGELTVAENVELPLAYRGMSGGERRRRVAEALERVGMAHRARHTPHQLSGGQQQRVAVARALVGEPMLLLADEPTGNLDTANGESVMELLAELHANGSTIIAVTHDPRFARRAQRTVRLLDGRVIADEKTPALAGVSG